MNRFFEFKLENIIEGQVVGRKGDSGYSFLTFFARRQVKELIGGEFPVNVYSRAQEADISGYIQINLTIYNQINRLGS